MITVQVGNYSNFVGAHIFNLQNPEVQPELLQKSSEDKDEKCFQNILWREVKSARGARPSFRPRLVIFDTKENAAVEVPQATKDNAVKQGTQQLWDGKVEDNVTNSGEDVQNKKKDRHEQTWGELISWKINSEQMHLTPNFSMNPETGQLSTYSQGLDVWKSLEEHSEDSIRKYAEECDRLEGFNILVDQLDGSSGIAGGLLQYISDEFDKKLCIGFGLCFSNVQAPSDSGKGRIFRSRMTNTSLLWSAFNSHSSVFTSLGLYQDFTVPELKPLNLPNLKYDFTSAYESSSILAAALDTLLSPCTSKFQTGSALSLSELASFLGAMGRKMTCVSTALPYPLEKNCSFFTELKNNGLGSLNSLTPGIDLDLDISNGNYFSVRGIPRNSVISDIERKQLTNYQRAITTPQSCLDLYAKESFSKAINIVQSYDIPLTITDPFPVSVLSEAARNNFNVSKKYSNGVVNSWSHSCISSAHNTVAPGLLINKVLNTCLGGRSKGTVTQTLPSTNELGMESDDFLDALNNLEVLKGCYDKGD